MLVSLQRLQSSSQLSKALAVLVPCDASNASSTKSLVPSTGEVADLTDKDVQLEGDKDREALEPDNLLEVRFREGIVSRVSPGN